MTEEILVLIMTVMLILNIVQVKQMRKMICIQVTTIGIPMQNGMMKYMLRDIIVIMPIRMMSYDGSFSCVVKTQRRWSNKIYKTELTKIRYNNQVLCKYRVDP